MRRSRPRREDAAGRWRRARRYRGRYSAPVRASTQRAMMPGTKPMVSQNKSMATTSGSHTPLPLPRRFGYCRVPQPSWLPVRAATTSNATGSHHRRRIRVLIIVLAPSRTVTRPSSGASAVPPAPCRGWVPDSPAVPRTRRDAVMCAYSAPVGGCVAGEAALRIAGVDWAKAKQNGVTASAARGRAYEWESDRTGVLGTAGRQELQRVPGAGHHASQGALVQR